MLVLEFSLDDRRYGIPAKDVKGIVPLPPVRALDLAPAWVAGVVTMLGRIVPVLDLCQLHLGRPCRRAFGTRVILVECTTDAGPRTLGLSAEGVTEVAEVEEAGLDASGVAVPGAPWLGPIGPDQAGRLVQIVTVQHLLTNEARALLFTDPTSL